MQPYFSGSSTVYEIRFRCRFCYEKEVFHSVLFCEVSDGQSMFIMFIIHFMMVEYTQKLSRMVVELLQP